MKLCLNNRNPTLTAEAKPSWICSKTCCFNALIHTPLACYQSFSSQCSSRYSYILQDNISDIFKL